MSNEAFNTSQRRLQQHSTDNKKQMELITHKLNIQKAHNFMLQKVTNN